MRYERNPHNGRIATPCERCGQIVWVWPSQSLRKYCSWACLHPAPTVADRFWAKVAVGRPDECWLWLATTDRTGYGRFRLRDPRRYVGAHRYAYFLTQGCWPDICRHTCDTPACCNPGHLVDGTQADNIWDAIERDRLHRPKVTAEDVAAIRALSARGVTYKAIAARYGISFGMVGQIVTRRAWAHVR